MRQNVSTPGGFFVGLGGIIAFCVVSSLVYLWVKNPAPNTELREQQAALGLAAAPDAPREEAKKKREETDVLLKAAAAKYNGGKKPDIDRLAELRGVVRFREAQKAADASAKALSAPSSIAGKSVLAAAIEEVAREIGAKKPAPSAMPLAESGPADPKIAPSLPNLSGGGVRTVLFADPNKSPAPAPATPPATGTAPPGAPTPPAPGASAPVPPSPGGSPSPVPPASAPAVPPAPAAQPVQPPPAAPPAPAPAPAAVPQANASLEAAAPVAAAAPSRPPLLNWSARNDR